MDTLVIKGITFGNSQKYQGFGTHRTVPPSETIERAKKVLPLIGATRVADITGLDRLGVPVTSVTVPEDRCGISTNNGKGLTKEAALAGGIMETIERYCSENIEHSIFEGAYAELSKTHNVLDPYAISPYLDIEIDLHQLPLEWLWATEVFSGEQYLVPARLVGMFWQGTAGQGIWLESTNGLGSGNLIEEAICHALNELIERDAHTLAVLKAKFKPNLSHFIQGTEPVESDPTGFDLIDLSTLPPQLTKITERISEAGVELIVREITSNIQVPSFIATLVEESWNGQYFCHGGAGTHPDKEVAIERAITESAQSRLTDFQGTREDMNKQAPSAAPDKTSFLTAAVGQVRSFDSVPTYRHQTVEEDVRHLLGALHQAGHEQVFWVNLTKKELDIPVVRVLVPGLEMWSVNHFNMKGCILGERARRVLELA